MAARKGVLHLSSSLDQPTKDKLLPVLAADYMSYDESVYLSVSGDSDTENHPAPLQTGRKKLRYHQLLWRSAEYDSYIKSLDRKIKRRKSARGQRMVIPVEESETISTRPPPDGAPDWVISPLYEPTDIKRLQEPVPVEEHVKEYISCSHCYHLVLLT